MSKVVGLLAVLPLLGIVVLVAAVSASIHAVLHKRDVRAAIGWVVFIWFAPIFGPLAYLVLGVNRVKRRAASIFGRRSPKPPASDGHDHEADPTFGHPGMARLVATVARRPTEDGNTVTPLVGGDIAYDHMLSAIDRASKSVALATYIFDHDRTGLQFADALERAVKRGVEVRVLIDAIGDRYSRPAMCAVLKRRGIKAVSFLPTKIPWRAPYFNLRNHRKILVADGALAYTGGMNIREGHRAGPSVTNPTRDVHFELTGPIVAQLQDVFAEDWFFAAQEELNGPHWFPTPLQPTGAVQARAISDGPDHDADRLLWTLLGALSCARERVKIVNPYFLPLSGLDRALQVAARRGVQVDIILPERNNLLLVGWASRSMWKYVLEGGCRIWLNPPPFDHSKLMLMDDDWSFIGTSNWDSCSLRLNFEVNVECIDRNLNQTIDDIIEEKRSQSTLVSIGELENRPFRIKLLDGASRLLAPYL